MDDAKYLSKSKKLVNDFIGLKKRNKKQILYNITIDIERRPVLIIFQR